MCMMCEGYTEAEMIAHWAARIREDGFVQLVIEEPPALSYTIGLRWSSAHPELIAVHPGAGKAGDVVGHVAEAVREGQQFRVGDRWTTPCGIPVRFGAVHHANLLRWLPRWPQLAAECDEATRGLRAVQVIVEGCDCVDCAGQVTLDRRRSFLPGDDDRRTRRRRRRH